MNELKPEDVMKALECWASGKPCQEECSILEHEEGASCLKLTARSALALLRERDALIAKHEAYIDTLNEDKSCLVEQIEKKDAEIERLKNDIAISKKETKRYMTSHKQGIAEAITEFAERLKSEVNGGQFASYKGLEIRNVINQIEKEMKEGKR